MGPHTHFSAKSQPAGTIQLIPEPPKMAIIITRRWRGTWECLGSAHGNLVQWVNLQNRRRDGSSYCPYPSYVISPAVAGCDSMSCTDNTFHWPVLDAPVSSILQSCQLLVLVSNRDWESQRQSTKVFPACVQVEAQCEDKPTRAKNDEISPKRKRRIRFFCRRIKSMTPRYYFLFCCQRLIRAHCLSRVAAKIICCMMPGPTICLYHRFGLRESRWLWVERKNGHCRWQIFRISTTGNFDFWKSWTPQKNSPNSRKNTLAFL